MNNITFVTPNVKGQVVIPIAMRKALGIEPNSPLAVSRIGNSISFTPVVGVVSKMDTEQSYLQLLQKTRGSWSDDSPDIKEVAKSKLELSASKRRKRAW